MPEGQSPLEAPRMRGRLWPRRKRWQFVCGVLIMLLGMLGYAWFSREQIARDIIADELQNLGIPAQYSIRSIGPEWQVLGSLVIGDPGRPDLTADEVSVRLQYGMGAPSIAEIKLVNPRLYGSYLGGELSFGSLDSVIFAESEEPAALPDFEVMLTGGRGLIETDYGPVGLSIDGEGFLSDGFSGTLALSAPQLSVDGCRADAASLFGEISTEEGRPKFSGPLRIRTVQCSDGTGALSALDWQLSLIGDPDLAGWEMKGALSAGSFKSAAFSGKEIKGQTRLTWRDALLTARYDLNGSQLDSPYASLAAVHAVGSLRANNGFERLDANADVEGTNLRPATRWAASLEGLQMSLGDTLAAPLAERLQRGLTRATASNTFRADASIRSDAQGTRVTIPQFLVQGPDNRSIAAASQIQVRLAEDGGIPRFFGNVTVGGRDLPEIRARMEQNESGSRVMRLRMAAFEAGDASLAVPQMTITQEESGAILLAGSVRSSGPLALDTRVENLILPVTGRIGADGSIALWERCARASASSFSYTSLSFDRPRIEVCPTGARHAVVLGSGTTVNLAISPLDLRGQWDGEPARLSSAGISYRSKVGVTAQDLEFSMGEGEGTTRFALSEIASSPGKVLGGTFEGAEMALSAVPLDISQGAGAWRYEEGVLAIDDLALDVTDREDEPRFERLVTQAASVRFEGGEIAAEGTLLEPFSSREVAEVSLRHDLSSGIGSADLLVQDLVFDEALQPAAGSDVCLNRGAVEAGFRPSTPGLSCLAFGVVANVRGVVNGTGRIDWNTDEVTSSGQFSTTDADLAAAFGPVEGVSGTVVFTDLLGLTTAPEQRFSVRAINPGIEVFDGTVDFSLRDGQILNLEGGSWPFMGGTLALESAELDFSQPEDRRYVLLIDGLDAARFVEQMELGNISATGVFDGAVPLVFDTDGNGRIENGLLSSRPPGGNVSYIGELTYEDLGTMANFAFQSLRSLDFSKMEVEMNGPLTGEIITRLKFDGVSQGEGSSSNLVTRQIARLPIQFRVNIRADFYSLLTNLQSLYDPAFVRDPRGLGLLETDGERFTVPGQEAIKPEELPEDDIPDEPAIQPQESESVP